MTYNYWGDDEPIEGNDCSVLSGSLWKSKACDATEHFVCVGKFDKNNLKLLLTDR